MSTSADTLFRLLILLQKIPHYPQKKSTSELTEILLGEGYPLTARTMQRDLEKLSGIFPLGNEEKGRSLYWFWTDKDKILQILTMSQSTALVFKLAEDYLRSLLPLQTLNELQPYLDRASEVLADNALSDWSDKVRTINKGLPLISPVIDLDVQKNIYQALFENKQINITYKARGREEGKEYIIHPHGLVIKDTVSYLLCTYDGYDEIRQLALHRMSKASLLKEPVVPLDGFSLNKYIEEQAFSYPTSGKTIKLKARIEPFIETILSETPLSTDQKIRSDKEDNIIVSTTVKDTKELLWWILSYGRNIEVIEPKSLRRDLSDISETMYHNYHPTEKL